MKIVISIQNFLNGKSIKSLVGCIQLISINMQPNFENIFEMVSNFFRQHKRISKKFVVLIILRRILPSNLFLFFYSNRKSAWRIRYIEKNFNFIWILLQEPLSNRFISIYVGFKVRYFIDDKKTLILIFYSIRMARRYRFTSIQRIFFRFKSRWTSIEQSNIGKTKWKCFFFIELFLIVQRTTQFFWMFIMKFIIQR